MTDIFTGEPGLSAPRYENDFAPVKRRCDVLINGSCYAPGGVPATRVPVGVRVGSITKTFNVVGHRIFERGPLSCEPGEPRPFTVLPIGYDNAFGGVDTTNANQSKHQWYLQNPAGKGYHPGASASEVDGRSLPNTEEFDKPVTRPDGDYRPMAFGPLGRSWQPRLKWAGTFDDKWLDEQFPFLPQDFDTQYFQCAPEDQQIDFPSGGEDVVLMHLTASGRTSFRLPPTLGLPFLFVSRTGSVAEVSGVVDTICIEPDKARFALAWRVSMPLRRNIREVREVIVGKTAYQLEHERTRAERMHGKRRFNSLTELVAWSQAQRRMHEAHDEVD